MRKGVLGMRAFRLFTTMVVIFFSFTNYANAACLSPQDAMIRSCILPEGIDQSLNAPVSMEICGVPRSATLVLVFKSGDPVIEKVTLSADKLTYLPVAEGGFTASFSTQIVGLTYLFAGGQFRGIFDCTP